MSSIHPSTRNNINSISIPPEVHCDNMLRHKYALRNILVKYVKVTITLVQGERREIEFCLMHLA